MIPRGQLDRWREEGIRQGASHLLACCYTSLGEYFPVFAREEQVEDELHRQIERPCSVVFGVYDLAADWEAQVAERFPLHLPPKKEATGT